MNENEVKKKALSSVVWKFMERIGAKLVEVIIGLMLARILGPYEYKAVAIVLVLFAFANVFITGGLNTALVQKKDADIEDYSTVFHISLMISIVLYIILFFCAPLIADIYKMPVLIPVIRVMGLSLPISAIKAIWCAYVSSNLEFKKFFYATLGGTVLSGIVGMVMALNGLGVWALVAQQMTNIAVDTIILMVITKLHIVMKISISKLKVLFRYGWKVFITSFIIAVYNEVVPLIIGIKYTDNALSHYSKGKEYPNMVSAIATSTLSAVMFPTLAKFQDDKDALLRYTRLFIQIASFFAFPLMLGFLAVSENFVHVMLGSSWLPAVPYIRIFCFASMFDMIHIGNCETIKAMGRSDVYLIMEIIKKSCYFLTIGLFLYFTDTPEKLANAYIICTIVAIAVNTFPNKKLIGYRFRDQIMDILPNLLTAGLMCGVCILVGMLPVPPIVSLILQLVVGVAVYLGLNILIKNKNLTYTLNFIKNNLLRKKKNEQ